MKRVIVTANPQSLRAFEMISKFNRDHFDFEAIEVDLPPAEATTDRPGQDDKEPRLAEMAQRINKLVESENPETWVLAAPAGIFNRLFQLLSTAARNSLSNSRTDDLVALPAAQIARRFAPQHAAA